MSPDSGANLTTYAGFERDFVTLGGDQILLGSLMRGDKDFVSGSFSIIGQADEGLVLDYFGNAFQASDTPDLPATVRVLGRVRDRSQATQSAVLRLDRDRDLGFKFDPFNPGASSETTLVAPKAVELAQVAGFMIVADAGDPAVKVWGSAAAGNVAPAFSSAVPAPAWDVALDEPSDRLYAALTDGTIAVFDDFLATRPAAPSRIIVPSVNGVDPAGTSLRGIIHTTARFADQLIVCDIGVEGEAAGTDGTLIFIDGASTANGLILPALIMDDPDRRYMRCADTGDYFSHDGFSLPCACSVAGREEFLIGFASLMRADLIQPVPDDGTNLNDHVNIAAMLVHDCAPVTVADQLAFRFCQIGCRKDRFFVLQERLPIFRFTHGHSKLVEPVSALGFFRGKNCSVFYRTGFIDLFSHGSTLFIISFDIIWFICT